MITVYAKCDCGCCTESLQFESVENANEALRRAGLGNGMVIVDDDGTEHTGLDTFYGFALRENESEDRGLGYLVEQIGTGD